MAEQNKDKVVVKSTYDDDKENWGEYASVEINVNGQDRFRIGSGEPEDMTLGRDLADAYAVVDLMQEMYKLGKEGVEVEFQHETINPMD